MTWKCKQCGSCCAILPMLIFGRVCPHFDSISRLCRIYESRPAMCRVSHVFGETVTEAYCESLRAIVKEL